jgi:glycosyltransferase involved in cell wall biosynthesis
VKEDLVVFVVLGRLGKNLTISKLAPICSIGSISKVYAFCEVAGFGFNEKLTYITLPNIILKIKPAFLSRIIKWVYEPLQILFYAIRYRPDYINGVYTLPKGLYSFVDSFFSKSLCIISIIGGKEEVESEFWFPQFWKTLNLFMLKYCWAVICKGERDVEYLAKEGIARGKIFVFNGGIDVNKFKSGSEIRNTDLIFAGKFDANKGPFRVLEMIQKLVLEFKDIKCVFLGDGKLKKSFESEIIRLGLINNVYCYGHVTNPEYYYQKSKIFILPSTNEGLSTAMLESMSCGCVAVVSNVGNTSEVVKNEINGFLIDRFNDIDSYVSYISMLLKDASKWSDYSKNAIMIVSDRYNYVSQARLFENVLQKRNESKIV